MSIFVKINEKLFRIQQLCESYIIIEQIIWYGKKMFGFHNIKRKNYLLLDKNV